MSPAIVPSPSYANSWSSASSSSPTIKRLHNWLTDGLELANFKPFQFIYITFRHLKCIFTFLGFHTWSPSSNAALRAGICLGESGGVAILNTSWASLNNWDELCICFWATSKTVFNLPMSSVKTKFIKLGVVVVKQHTCTWNSLAPGAKL